MKRHTCFLLLFLPAFQGFGGTTLNTISQLDEFLKGGTKPQTAFDVTGTVIAVDGDLINVDNGKQCIRIPKIPHPLPSVGDKVRVQGLAEVLPTGELAFSNDCPATILANGPVSPPARISLGEIDKRLLNNRRVVTQGDVCGMHVDEIDPSFSIILVKDASVTIPVFVSGNPFLVKGFDIGATIQVTGTFRRNGSGGRKFTPSFISCERQDLAVVIPAPADPFDVPRLETQLYLTPEEIDRLGRRSAVGRVLATWNGNQMMIRTDADRIVNVWILPELSLPEPGEVVTVVGHPETDYYRLNLTFARWRSESAQKLDAEPLPLRISLEELYHDRFNRSVINCNYHGTLITVSGTLRDRPVQEGKAMRFHLETETRLIAIDCNSAPTATDNIEVGSRIEVTGYCLMESYSTSKSIFFPQARGFTIVIRSPDDIRLVETPPWWTPGRFLLTILVLLAILTGVFLWNLSLQALAKRRGRQLFKAQFDKASSELRVDERTRLAVELHDSLAQNLASVSMEITTALCMDKDRSSEMMRHLTIADKGLKACCLDLRDTLWDLRSEALEEPTVDRAIRKTLLPHLKGVSLALRFNVPRARFSDKTLREILCIIRELTVNGIRHGRATEIKIAGALEDDTLRFSVRDNGCGFDPSSVPGVDEGHYGLSGIRDRLRRLGGTLTFESQSEGGTKAIVSL